MALSPPGVLRRGVPSGAHLRGVVRPSCAWLLTGWCLMAVAAACSGGASGGVEVQVGVAAGAPMPETLRLDWLDGAIFRVHDLRVPADGVLVKASPLAKVRIEVAADARGARRVVVRGLVGTQVVSEGTAAVDVTAGSWVVASVSLASGRRPDGDGDGVPDEVDQCPGDRTTFGSCPAADGGVDAAPPADTMAPEEAAVADADASPDDLAVPVDAPPDLPALEAAGPEAGAPPTFPCGAVLLVVGVANHPADKAMTARLAQMTCTVTTVDDSMVSMADGNGKSLAIISETVTPSQVMGKLKLITAGLIEMNPNLLDDMSFNGHTQATDWDLGAMETTVTIAAPAHPLAANLTGSRPIFSSAALVGWTTPDSAAAIKVAAFPATPTRLLVSAFDTGATMSMGFKAAGRRVAFLASRDAVPKLNADGWALFDAAVRWASGH
jgi:hypothetical protein